MQKKLLILTDTPLLSTGLSRICKEISQRLSQHYEIAIAGWHHTSTRHNFSSHIYPVTKGYQIETSELHVALKDFLPDILLCIGDLWDFNFLQNSVQLYRDNIKPLKTVLWVTIDGEYLDPSWGDTVRMFDAVASFSNFGISELKKYSANRDFKVIYPGIDHTTFFKYPINFKPTLNVNIAADLDKTFTILNVGQNCERKNIPAAIEAFKEFSKNKTDTIMILVTDPIEKKGQDLFQIIKRLELQKTVFILKNVNPRQGISDEHLNYLYNTATVLLNTGIGEGFGMPIAEAQAAGCVPIVTNYAAAVELVKNKGFLLNVAEIFYGQYGIKRAVVSKDSIIYNLELLYNDFKKSKNLINSSQKKCINFAKTLNWEKAAIELHNLIEDTDISTKHSWVKTTEAKKNPRILQVVPTWGKNCGIAEYSKELINAIENENEKVSVYPSKDLTKLIAAAENFDTVVFQHEFSFYRDKELLHKTLKTLHEHNKRTVIELHTYLPANIYNSMLLDSTDAVIVHCDLFKNKIAKDAHNLYVVKMGCKEKVNIDAHIARNALNFNGNFPVIGSFGFIREQKGYKEIAQTIQYLVSEYKNIRFLLAAPTHEFGSKYYEETFYRYIEDMQISDRTICLREYMQEDKLMQYLSSVDIFVLNYKDSNAGGGNSAAIKTLMRVQRPIIVSDTLYFADLKDEVYKIKNTDADSIKSALEILLKDKDLQKQLVLKANEFLKENSWKNVVRRHLDIYAGRVNMTENFKNNFKNEVSHGA
jgi:glycosyltransferase involved in cell wall biosynthesis